MRNFSPILTLITNTHFLTRSPPFLPLPSKAAEGEEIRSELQTDTIKLKNNNSFETRHLTSEIHFLHIKLKINTMKSKKYYFQTRYFVFFTD